MSSANNAFNLKGATGKSTLSNIFKPKLNLGKRTGTGSGLGSTLNVNTGLFAPNSGLKVESTPARTQAPVAQKKTTAGLMSTYKPPAGTVNIGTQQKPNLIPEARTNTPQPQVRSEMRAQAPAPTAPQPTYPTYTGLISEYANMARQGSEDVQKAREALQRFQQGMAEKYAGIETQGIPLEFVQGRQGALQRAAATTEQSLQTGVQNALSQQQQQLGALGSAAGLLAPIQAPYSNQILQFGQGGQLQPLTGGAGDLQSAVQNIAQKVSTGQMTYDQGVAALGGYGQAGVNALQQALPSGFNVAQSETLARQQGQVGPALENARLSLNKLEDTMKQLVIPGQSSGFVPLNELTNWASRNLGWGKQQTAAVNGMVNEVRNSLQNALALTGTNPTEATAQSYSLLPDNPSMQNLLAAKQVLEGLGQIKQQVYGNPGLQGSQQGGGGFAESWF